MASWTLQDVEAHALGAAVRALPGHAASRTAVLTLVTLTSGVEATARAVDVILELAERHPLHALVAQTGGPHSTISATARCHGSGARGVCLTDVVVRCDPADVTTLVEQVRLPGLPVIGWYVDRLPDPVETLPDTLDGVVLDSQDATPDDVASLLSLTERARVVDLSWLRLRPWRQLFGGLFATEAAARFLPAVERVRVGGDPSSRALLAGWLASRLRLPAGRIDSVPAPAPAVRLRARREGTDGVFAVEPGDDPSEIVAVAAIDGGPSHRRLLPAPGWTLIDQLDLALTRRDRDPATYRHVLATSAALALWPTRSAPPGNG